MLIALAVGLGTVDMPIPQIAAWEWVSWKFPRAVRAGETIYARWTLTQKRPPVHGAKTGIAVWRVDVHTLDGAMAAEGEIGASIVRRSAVPAERQPAEGPAAPPRRRRRGRRGSGQGEAAPAPAAAPIAPAAAAAERSPSRRRRRKRGSGSGGNGNGGNNNHAPAAEAAPEVPPPAPAPEPAPQPAATQARGARVGADGNPISRVMKRLRRS